MLSAQDIQAQQFHLKFRGFDTDEVDDFLEKVAATVLELSEENSELREKLTAMSQKLNACKRKEKSALQAIVSAQKVVDEMQEKARKEAEEIRDKAKREAAELVESANQEVSGLERELDRLKSMKGSVKEELRRVLNNYSSMLDKDGYSAGIDHKTELRETGERSEGISSAESMTDENSDKKPQSKTLGTLAAAGLAAAVAAKDDAKPEKIGPYHELYERIVLDDDPMEEDSITEAEEESPETSEQDSEPETLPETEPVTEIEADIEEDATVSVSVGFELDESEMPEEEDKEKKESPVATEEEDDDDDSALPDLDGDMVFNFDDPLDDEDLEDGPSLR